MTSAQGIFSANRQRFAFLDFGRAAACLLVVLYHASGTVSQDKYFGDHPWAALLALGFIRMPFFLAMSGFLLAWLYLRPGATVRPTMFFAKRASRLFPLYWIVLCAVAAVEILVFRSVDVMPEASGWWQTFFLLPQDAVLVGGTGAPVLYPAWVLQYELVGYVLLALSLSSRVLRTAYIHYFPLCYLLWADSEVFALRFLGSDWLLIFWFGVVAALAAPTWTPGQLRWVMRAALACLSAAALVHGSIESARIAWRPLINLDLLYGGGFALLIAGLANLAHVKQATAKPSVVSRALGRIAVWSYAIFLLHAPVISFVCKVMVAMGLSGTAWWPIAVLMSLAASVVAGALAQRLVEAPVDRMIVQAWHRLSATRAALR